jgi:hypothetical protein
MSSYKTNPDDPATIIVNEAIHQSTLEVVWFICFYNLHDWMDKEYERKGGTTNLTDKYLLLDLDIISRLYQAVVTQQLKGSINNLTKLVITLVECHKLIEDGFNVMYETL